MFALVIQSHHSIAGKAWGNHHAGGQCLGAVGGHSCAMLGEGAGLPTRLGLW